MHIFHVGGKVIVTTTSANPTPVEVLVLTDHLGSTYALINRETGYSLNQGFGFDAFGQRRDTDWSNFTTTELVTFDTSNTRRWTTMSHTSGRFWLRLSINIT